MSLETEIKKLTIAIQELHGLMGANTDKPVAPVVEPVVEPTPEPVEPTPEPVAQVVEPTPEPKLLVIPTVADLQKSLGVIAQEYAPIYPITAIKSLGEGRLSDLDDDQRVQLAILMDAVKTKLGSMTKDDITCTTPEAVIESCK